MKFSEDLIKKELKAKGFDLIDYSGLVTEKSKVRCPNGHEIQVRVRDILRNKSFCAVCSGNYKISECEIRDSLQSLGFTLISYAGNSLSKSILMCDKGHVIMKSYNVLVNKKHGCAKCANVEKVKFEDAYERCEQRGYTLLNFNKSGAKATFMCEKSHIWEAVYNSVINRGRGCPHCSVGGFKIGKQGFLYLLLSENGKHIKVGITNDIKRRLAYLKFCTPFDFSLYRNYCSTGIKVSNAENQILSKFEKAKFSGFGGATEWLNFDQEIAKFCESYFNG